MNVSTVIFVYTACSRRCPLEFYWKLLGRGIYDKTNYFQLMRSQAELKCGLREMRLSYNTGLP